MPIHALLLTAVALGSASASSPPTSTPDQQAASPVETSSEPAAAQPPDSSSTPPSPSSSEPVYPLKPDFKPTPPAVIAKLHARPSLHLERTALVPGQTGHLAISFEIEPDWHLYWRGQNDAGLHIDSHIALPTGATLGPAMWPVPKREVLPGDIVNYVYYSRVSIIIPVTPPADYSESTFPIQVTLSWLVCQESCIGEDARLKIVVPISAPLDERKNDSSISSPPLSAAAKPFFDLTRRLQPMSAADSLRHVRISSDSTSATFTVDRAVSIAFMPDILGVVIPDAATSGYSKSNTLHLAMIPSSPPAPAKPLLGILEVTYPNDPKPHWYQIHHPLAPQTQPQNLSPK